MKPLRIGVVGCGNISGIYFQNLRAFRSTQVVACADLDFDRARAVGTEWGVPGMTTDELLNRDDVDLVLNLTVPKAHAEVAIRALESGRHVYNEKPLALSQTDAQAMLELATRRGLRVGCAPDTFLGAGLQTCREAIDRGDIGEPVAAQAFMLCHGHETWHPSPEFYYEAGGGPMFDMGPYYLTALVSLIGPIQRVAGMARATFPTRTITSEPKRGKQITVETPTHVAGLIQFDHGAIGELTTSFDVWPIDLPSIVIHGAEGTMIVPDPNGFGGPIQVRTRGESEWRSLPIERPFAENSRGVGVLDMAHAISQNRPHRASGALGAHVLDAMRGFLDAAADGSTRSVSPAKRPTALAPTEFADEFGR